MLGSLQTGSLHVSLVGLFVCGILSQTPRGGSCFELVHDNNYLAEKYNNHDVLLSELISARW